MKNQNSKKLKEKVEKVQKYENLLKKNGIFYEYPDVVLHPDEPMLGHTKGNTKNNRKKIKKHQDEILNKILNYLEEIIQKNNLCEEKIYNYEYKND